MTALRQRMLADLHLRGLAPKPPPGDIEAVHHLAHHDRRAPDQLSAAELRQSFLFLLHEQQVAESTVRMHLEGMRFFYERPRQRPWPVFALVRPRKSLKRPVVWSPQEGRHLLALVEHPKARMCLRTISACGLRLREGTPRQVSDRDAQRLLVRGDQGQGGNDRFVPLPPRIREVLREYGPRGRPRPWWFPARHRPTSLSPTSLQKTFTAVVRPSGSPTEASSHTLRHSSAPHLLERGVARRGMQALLGHTSPRTTARDTPLTAPTLAIVHAPINALMAER